MLSLRAWVVVALASLGITLVISGIARVHDASRQELSPRFCFLPENNLESGVCSKLWHEYDRSFDV